MRRQRLNDVGLTALVLLAQSAPYLFAPRPDAPHAMTFIDYLPVLVTSLPVLVRRYQPIACLIVTSLGIGLYAIIDTGPPQPIWYGPLVCFYTVAYQGKLWERRASVVIALIGGFSIIGSVNTAIRELAMWTAAYALGAFALGRKEAAQQAEQLAAEQERIRIMRDLHDILGHSFSLMIVQAEAGGAVARHDPVKAEAAFDAIAAHGRDAMGQLRASLRDSPQPTLDDLPELVRQAEHDGMSVRLREVGEPRRVSFDVQLAAYRIVQEALTNAIKHARATNVEVLLDWEPQTLEVRVTDDGIGAASIVDGGQGLAGIRERVKSVGGKVAFGNVDNGGFYVKAVFA